MDNLNPYPGTLKFIKLDTTLPFPVFVNNSDEYVDWESKNRLKEINDNLHNYIKELIKNARTKDAERIEELESILQKLYDSYVSTEPLAYEIGLWDKVKNILKK
jgi:hypothetical protein